MPPYDPSLGGPPTAPYDYSASIDPSLQAVAAANNPYTQTIPGMVHSSLEALVIKPLDHYQQIMDKRHNAPWAMMATDYVYRQLHPDLFAHKASAPAESDVLSPEEHEHVQIVASPDSSAAPESIQWMEPPTFFLDPVLLLYHDA